MIDDLVAPITNIIALHFRKVRFTNIFYGITETYVPNSDFFPVANNF